MTDKKIEQGEEILQTANEVSGLANDVGAPGIGLLASFVQNFYDKHLQKRFQ